MRSTFGESVVSFLFGPFARGVALFFGCFGLLNLLGEMRYPGFDENIWWLDLRTVPEVVQLPLMIWITVSFIAFAIWPRFRIRGIKLASGAAVVGALVSLVNAGQYFRELFAGNIHSKFPVPFSLVVCAAFCLIAISCFQPTTPDSRVKVFFQTLFSFAFCLFIFPVLQVLSFGKTDYQRTADVIVVLGARAYANGELSDALADRVRTAADLYRKGLAKKVIMSGGPGDGDIHETEAMKRHAMKLGVPEEAILKDEMGLNTQATVDNTVPMFDQMRIRRVLVVSHFYHLPRIKMTYRREGWDVWTVPAQEAYFLSHTPYMVVREIAALWVYYLRPLRDISSLSDIVPKASSP